MKNMKNYIFTLEKRIYIYIYIFVCIHLCEHFNETQFVGEWFIGGKYKIY